MLVIAVRKVDIRAHVDHFLRCQGLGGRAFTILVLVNAKNSVAKLGLQGLHLVYQHMSG